MPNLRSSMELTELQRGIEEIEKEFEVENEKEFKVDVDSSDGFRNDLIEWMMGQSSKLRETIPNDDKRWPPVDYRLPDEMRDALSMEIEKVRDKSNMYEVCKLYRKFVVETRPIWLFEEILPYLCTYLDKMSILTCRTICKRWNYAVDKFIEELPALHPYSEDNFNPRQHRGLSNSRVLNISRSYEFFTAGSIFKFLRVMELHDDTRNPIIGRAVSFHERRDCECDPDYAEIDFLEDDFQNDVLGQRWFWHGILKFLEKFGKLIYRLEISTDIKTDAWHGVTFAQGAYAFLVTVGIFAFTPNLRTLIIGGELHKQSFQSMLFNPHPSLETLSLNVDCQGVNVHQLVNVVSRQVKRLEGVSVKALDDLSGFNFHSPPPPPLDWTNLAELVMAPITHPNKDLPLLVNHLKRFPKLKRLTLSIENSRPFSIPSVDLVALLAFLNELAKVEVTIGIIQLKDWDVKIDVAGIMTATEAPTGTTTLELEVSDSARFSFLLKFPHLKYLHIVTKGDGRNSSQGAKLNESNLWDMLPLLELFTFNSKLFLRQKNHIVK